MIEAVIFDLDGTLVNIPIDYETLYKKIIKVAEIDKIESLTKTLQKLSGKQRIKAFEVWTREELKALPQITVNKEGMKLYKVYSNKPLALVTMQGKPTVIEIMKKLNLKFQFIITREDSLDRVQQIKMALNKLQKEPGKVLIIGDRESDAAAACEIGCQFKRVQNENMV